MPTPKKWPEEIDLLAWWIYAGLNEVSEDAPEIILRMINQFQELEHAHAHNHLYKQFREFRERYRAPEEWQDRKPTDVSAILTESKEAIGEELHRQFNPLAEKKG